MIRDKDHESIPRAARKEARGVQSDAENLPNCTLSYSWKNMVATTA
jgi:hypothetical protein